MTRQVEPGWKFLGSRESPDYNLLTSNPIDPMLIDTVCTNCDAILKAPEAVLGRRVKCTKCGKPFVARRPGDDEAEEELPTTVKMKAPTPPKRKSDEDEDDFTEEAPPVKSKKPTRRIKDDEDTAVMKKASASSDDDDEDEDNTPKPKGKKRGNKGKKKQAGSHVMMYVLIGVGALILLGGGGAGIYFGFIRDESKPVTPDTKGGTPVAKGGTPGDSVTANWHEVHDAAGRYRIKFPTQPKKQTMTEDEPPFGRVEKIKYELASPAEAFVCEHVILPKDRPPGLNTDDELLDTIVAEARKALEAGGIVMKDVQSIKHKGFAARLMTMELVDKNTKKVYKLSGLSIVAGDRLISVATMGSENLSVHDPRAKAFVDSLKIE